MVKAKLAILTLLFFGSAFAAFIDLSNASEEGCEDSTGVWRCHIPSEITGADVKFVGDIACFSTVSDGIDQGCFGEAQLTKDTYVKDCTYSITDEKEMVYNECGNVSLAKDSSLFVMVDPSILDLASCDKYVASELYVNQCAYDGKELPIDGTIDLTQDEIPTVLVTKIGGKEIVSGWLMDNLLYIILIIVIIIIAYFVFAPHKPMFKERKETPKATDRYTSKRENRYGRKL